MDDFVIFHNDKEFLWNVKKQFINYLSTLKLEVHDNKTRIYKTACGVPFLGILVYPTHRRIKRENLVRYKQRLRKFQNKRNVEFKKVHQSVQSWIGHTRHADAYRIRRLVFGDFVLQSGEGD